jgi:hypothetical protein
MKFTLLKDEFGNIFPDRKFQTGKFYIMHYTEVLGYTIKSTIR